MPAISSDFCIFIKYIKYDANIMSKRFHAYAGPGGCETNLVNQIWVGFLLLDIAQPIPIVPAVTVE